MRSDYHFYTTEEIDYLREISKLRDDDEIAEMFNEKFGTSLSVSKIIGTRKRYKIRKGYRPNQTAFKEGEKPWNYGIATGIVTSGAAVKGNARASVSNGTERNKAGYTQVKTAYPNTWEYKHRLVWEEENGEVPEDHVIIFGDKDKRNFSADNLICMSRAELIRMSCGNLIQEDADLTRTMLNVVKIDSKIAELKKGD